MCVVAQGERLRKAQQSARAALEQQRQTDAVVEKERQKKEKEVARKKKKAEYMAEEAGFRIQTERAGQGALVHGRPSPGSGCQGF